MANITTVLFDFDGTVIDSSIYAAMYTAVLTLLLKKKGKRKEDVDAYCSKRAWLKIGTGTEARYDSGDLCEAFGIMDEYYSLLKSQVNRKVVLNQKVADAIVQCKAARKKIGIVSNSREKTIHIYLDAYGLSKKIDFIASSHDILVKKHHADYWKRVCEKYKLKAEECLVVGNDHKEDGEIPNAVGMKTIAVSDVGSIADMFKNGQ